MKRQMQVVGALSSLLIATQAAAQQTVIMGAVGSSSSTAGQSYCGHREGLLSLLRQE